MTCLEHADPNHCDACAFERKLAHSDHTIARLVAELRAVRARLAEVTNPDGSATLAVVMRDDELAGWARSLGDVGELPDGYRAEVVDWWADVAAELRERGPELPAPAPAAVRAAAVRIVGELADGRMVGEDGSAWRVVPDDELPAPHRPGEVEPNTCSSCGEGLGNHRVGCAEAVAAAILWAGDLPALAAKYERAARRTRMMVLRATIERLEELARDRADELRDELAELESAERLG